jgi:hypothetical protein
MSDTNCVKCNKVFVSNGFSTGYGTNLQGERICFDCCALDDIQSMREKGKYTLYLTKTSGKYVICNWPGTLKIRPMNVTSGRHNIAGTRKDCWFVFDGFWWHGVQYGEWTEVLHCKKTKQIATTIQSTIDLPESYPLKGF